MKHLAAALDPTDDSAGRVHQFLPLVLAAVALVLVVLMAMGQIDVGTLPGYAQALVALLFAIVGDYLRKVSTMG